MESLLPKIQIKVSDGIFLKNPESSDLGKKIVQGSIYLICEIGFEQFTFRKLAEKIGSTEASVYRYFESKHKILLYLSNWYWSWMEYRLVFSITNVESLTEQLKRSIDLLTEVVEEDGSFEHINEQQLHKIVVSESMKAYLTKEVDEENKIGAFLPYKTIVERISQLILQINPNYKYPHMLVSTIIEGAHLQRHFAAHLPKLTDQIKGEDAVSEFYHQIAFNAIKTNHQ